jgi:hypothetical protein
MSDLCPLYLQEKSCLLKIVSNSKITSVLSKIDYEVINNSWTLDCEGSLSNCSFKNPENKVVEVPEPEKVIEEPAKPEVKIEQETTKVSIHIVKNPYAVKSDVLFYPTNIALTVDDPLMLRLSFGKIQEECDTFKKPYKMGTLYITQDDAFIGKVDERINVKFEKKILQDIPFIHIEGVVVLGRATISPAVVDELMTRHIPLTG